MHFVRFKINWNICSLKMQTTARLTWQVKTGFQLSCCVCVFFSAISNSDLVMLCLLQNLTGVKFCWLHEFCVAMVCFWFCLCMLSAHIGLATCALCVLLFPSIFLIVSSFWFLSLTNSCRLLGRY